MYLQVVGLFFVILSAIKLTEACNGYNLKIDYIKTCSDNSVGRSKNLDFSFDENCNLVMTGCFEIDKPVKTAKTAYEINKPPLPTLTGDVDLCAMFGNTKRLVLVQQAIEAFAVPKKCPIPAKTYCVNGKKLISIAAYKNKLGLALGTISTKFNIDHDVGSSCIQTKFTISKKK